MPGATCKRHLSCASGMQNDEFLAACWLLISRLRIAQGDLSERRRGIRAGLDAGAQR